MCKDVVILYYSCYNNYIIVVIFEEFTLIFFSLVLESVSVYLKYYFKLFCSNFSMGWTNTYLCIGADVSPVRYSFYCQTTYL